MLLVKAFFPLVQTSDLGFKGPKFDCGRFGSRSCLGSLGTQSINFGTSCLEPGSGCGNLTNQSGQTLPAIGRGPQLGRNAPLFTSQQVLGIRASPNGFGEDSPVAFDRATKFKVFGTGGAGLGFQLFWIGAGCGRLILRSKESKSFSSQRRCAQEAFANAREPVPSLIGAGSQRGSIGKFQFELCLTGLASGEVGFDFRTPFPQSRFVSHFLIKGRTQCQKIVGK